MPRGHDNKKGKATAKALEQRTRREAQRSPRVVVEGISCGARGWWKPGSENPDPHPTEQLRSAGTPDPGHPFFLSKDDK
jgi:hypothetical protein